MGRARHVCQFIEQDNKWLNPELLVPDQLCIPFMLSTLTVSNKWETEELVSELNANQQTPLKDSYLQKKVSC